MVEHGAAWLASCADQGAVASPALQLAVGTWILALVTMQLDLPHPAVMEVRGCGVPSWGSCLVDQCMQC